MYEEFLKGKKSAGRCPKCGKDSLEYDESSGILHCSSCGYKEIISRKQAKR